MKNFVQRSTLSVSIVIGGLFFAPNKACAQFTPEQAKEIQEIFDADTTISDYHKTLLNTMPQKINELRSKTEGIKYALVYGLDQGYFKKYPDLEEKAKQLLLEAQRKLTEHGQGDSVLTGSKDSEEKVKYFVYIFATDMKEFSKVLIAFDKLIGELRDREGIITN